MPVRGRPRTSGLLVAAAALGALLLGGGAGAADSTRPVTVDGAGTATSPYVYRGVPDRITAGDTVTWLNQTTADHTVTPTVSPDQGFKDHDLDGQGSYEQYRFTVPGTYTFHCRHHPDTMHATLVVDAAAPTPAPTSPPTALPAPRPAPTATPRHTPRSTARPTSSATPTPVASAAARTATPAPSAAARIATPAPVSSPTPAPSPSPTPAAVTPGPVAEATDTPSGEPTATPTPLPTAPRAAPLTGGPPDHGGPAPLLLVALLIAVIVLAGTAFVLRYR